MPDAWEACFTLGDHSWAWAKDSVYMSSGTFIRYLVKAVARNGNVLLGIGPDDHGELDTQTVAALKQIGAWLKVNGEAIYGTRPMKPYESGDVFFTRKPDGTVYAIALSAKDGDPMPKRVRIPAALVQKGKTVTLVGGDGTPLAAEPAADGAADIVLPEELAAPCAAAWAFKLLGAARAKP